MFISKRHMGAWGTLLSDANACQLIEKCHVDPALLGRWLFMQPVKLRETRPRTHKSGVFGDQNSSSDEEEQACCGQCGVSGNGRAADSVDLP